MGCRSAKEDREHADEQWANSNKRLDQIEDSYRQISEANAASRQAEISFLQAALAAFETDDSCPAAKTILQVRLTELQRLHSAQAAPSTPSVVPIESKPELVPETRGPEPAAPEAGAAAEAPQGAVGPDHPFFCHEHGVAATLQALKHRGDAEATFAPLLEEFEHVAREAGSTEYDSVMKEPELTVEAREDKGSKFMVIRTVDVIPGAHVKELFRVVHDTALRLKWEKKFMGSDKTVHPIKEFEGYLEGEHEVFLFQYPGMMFVKGREFLDRRCTFRDEARQLFLVIQGVARGIERPKNKKFIRAATVYQCTMCYAVPGGAAVYNCILADPGGSLSTSMVNHQSKVHPTKWHKALCTAYKAIADKQLAPVEPPAAGPRQKPQGHARTHSQDVDQEPDQPNPLASTAIGRSASVNDVTQCSPHLASQPGDPAVERRISEEALRVESSPRHMPPEQPVSKDALVALINGAAEEVPVSPGE